MLPSAQTLIRAGHARLGIAPAQRAAIWTPLPDKPQQVAYESPADVLGYGGAAGGGKTDLGLGLAFTRHRRSIVFRRRFTDLNALVERGDEIQAGACTFVWGVKRRWETPDGRFVELGAVDNDKDKYKYRGNPHDLIVIDEAADFSESVFRFVTGWLRTTAKGQRTRIVLTFNPPQTADGEWIVRYFAPWLDETHPNPAAPGELRWFARIDDEDVEVSADWRGVDPVTGDPIAPKSRTFIPARVEDNPYLMATDYIKELNDLPEPLRSQLRYGDFTIGQQDDIWQAIPTAWVLAAQQRGREMQPPDLKARARGADIARGGKDKTVTMDVRGTYFDTPKVYPGSSTPDGAVAAKLITDGLEDGCELYIDAIGIGSSAYDHAKVMPGVTAHAVNNSAASTARDKSKRYGFTNIRAEDYWKLREALDPGSGENIALPDIRELRVDLCAPRYSVVGGKIKLESKDEVIVRTGHSPDMGDAAVLAWHGARRKPRGSVELI